jgi:hypothetical protein
MTRQFIGEDGTLLYTKRMSSYKWLCSSFFLKRQREVKKRVQGKHQIVTWREWNIYYHLSDPRSEFYNIPLGICHIHIMSLVVYLIIGK